MTQESFVGFDQQVPLQTDADGELRPDDAGELQNREDGDDEGETRDPGYPAPFVALQYPLLRTSDGDKQTRAEATLNLLNNLLGAGLLTMPKAMANAGLLTGLAVMVLVAIANRYTLLLVLWMSENALEDPSYPEIGKRIFGRQGMLMVLAAYLLFTGGILTAYLIALTDIFQQLPVLSVFPRFVLVGLGVAVCAPGAMLRSLRHVAKLSGICMIGVCTLVLVLTALCVSDVLSPAVVGASSGAAAARSWDLVCTKPQGLFAGAALFALQFSVQAGGIEVLSRIMPDERESSGAARGRSAASSTLAFGADSEDLGADADAQELSSMPAAESVTKGAFVLAVVLSGTIGAAGYIRFGNAVAGDVLLSFGPDAPSLALFLARVAYGFVVTCSFAFVMVPCRFAAMDVLALRRSNQVGPDTGALIPERAFRQATGGILLACSFVALFVPDLSRMLGFVGVSATMALAFIFPCCFLMELRRQQESRPLLSVANLLPLGLLAFAILVVLSSVAGLFANIAGPTGGAVGRRTVVHDLSSALRSRASDAAPP
eukprot:CAMPEP_0117466308 /NCGR_PEP_ID=MMETSP0784-20121206/5077_1 /TAXON_ID=39447 /ORGANISM="" /LENGTH=544 /DNA_ID=CAMNT_0005260249 /DNA_START=40 /DNA_END=1674 /DNA_ORIENTATION=+